MTKNNPKLEKTTIKIDWSAFSYALLVLLASILISIGFIFVSYEYVNKLHTWKAQQDRELMQMEHKHREIQESVAILTSDDYQHFNQLVTRGFFKITQEVTLEEILLEMTETIRNALDGMLPQFKIPNAKWKFSSQPVPYELPQLKPEVRIYRIPLTLELGVLHEADMLNLLQFLETQKNIGLFNLQYCEIKRLSDKLDVTVVNKSYFAAICILNWFTAKIEEQ